MGGVNLEQRRSATSSRTAASSVSSIRIAEGTRDERRDLVHLRSSRMPSGCRRRRANGPARREGRAGVAGHLVLVQRDAGLVERLLRHLACHVGVPGAQVDEHQVVIGATRHEAEALGHERLRQRTRVLHDLTRVVAEFRLRGFVERDRFGRDHMHQRAALQPREHRLVDGRRMLSLREDAAAARAAQRLVRREGHDIGIRHRVRC